MTFAWHRNVARLHLGSGAIEKNRNIRYIAVAVLLSLAVIPIACGASSESYLRKELAPLAQIELRCPSDSVITRCLDENCRRALAVGCGRSAQYGYGNSGWTVISEMPARNNPPGVAPSTCVGCSPPPSHRR